MSLIFLIIIILIFGFLMTKTSLGNIFPMSFDYNKFQDQLSLSESSNSYSNHSNGIAYGRYQFIPATIERIANELGISKPTIQQFLDDNNLQDAFYVRYVQDILKYISDNKLDFFIGKSITGKKNYITTQINVYGLVAGAWLSGEGGLYNFLNHGIDKNDGTTYISDYVAKFSQLNNLLA